MPTIILGPAATAMERRDIQTFLSNINHTARKTNSLISAIAKGITSSQTWIMVKKASTTPNTGDDQMIVVWASMLILTACVGAVVIKKKKSSVN